jgi:hypothetical protein
LALRAELRLRLRTASGAAAEVEEEAERKAAEEAGAAEEAEEAALREVDRLDWLARLLGLSRSALAPLITCAITSSTVRAPWEGSVRRAGVVGEGVRGAERGGGQGQGWGLPRTESNASCCKASTSRDLISAAVGRRPAFCSLRASTAFS